MQSFESNNVDAPRGIRSSRNNACRSDLRLILMGGKSRAERTCQIAACNRPLAPTYLLLLSPRVPSKSNMTEGRSVREGTLNSRAASYHSLSRKLPTAGSPTVCCERTSMLCSRMVPGNSATTGAGSLESQFVVYSESVGVAMERRDFLKNCAMAGVAGSASAAWGQNSRAEQGKKEGPMD